MKSLAFKTTATILALGFLGLAGSAYAGSSHGHDAKTNRVYGERIDKRQTNQMERIEAGYRNGKLTQREFRTLMKEQRDIHAMERRFRADGRIDAREFAHLDRALDTANRNIRDEKHDRQARNNQHPRHVWHR